MKQIRSFITLFASLAIIFSSCDSSYKDDLIFDAESNSSMQSRGGSIENENILLAKNIVFENNTFSLKISREEALRQGASEKAYNDFLKILERRNEKVKEIIDAGGTYEYTNCIANPQQNCLSYEPINRNILKVPDIDGWGPSNGQIVVGKHPTDTIYAPESLKQLYLNTYCDIITVQGWVANVVASCNLIITGQDKDGRPIGYSREIPCSSKGYKDLTTLPGVRGDKSKPHFITLELVSRPILTVEIEYMEIGCKWWAYN